MTVAAGSASEVRYLLELSGRLAFIPEDYATAMAGRYEELIRGIQRLLAVLNPKP